MFPIDINALMAVFCSSIKINALSIYFKTDATAEFIHLNSPAAVIFDKRSDDYVPADHLSIIVYSPPRQFDWPEHFLPDHKKQMFWAGFGLASRL